MVNQRVAKLLLTKIGYEVLCAVNGAVALEILEGEEGADIDLVLMDCQMPIMDGYEATARIRSLESPMRSLPIIAMTANSMKGDREKCLEIGMDDYLSKPIRREKLESVLADWLGRKTLS